MLVRKRLRARFSQHTLPTRMGRSLLVAELASGELPCTVGTVHLESLDSAPTRREQLEVAHHVLERCRQPSILCGDFNFDASQERCFSCRVSFPHACLRDTLQQQVLGARAR